MSRPGAAIFAVLGFVAFDVVTALSIAGLVWLGLVATWEGAGLHERPWADIAWKNAPSRFAD
jgi:hypothetical protein